MKKALITGVTGQDGAYLAQLLLSKGYEVHGIKRRASLFNTNRIDHIYEDPHAKGRHFMLHYGDLTDSSSLIQIVQQVKPDEIYNLAAQSHVKVSFEEPEYTANSDALGTLRLLEAIRIAGLEKITRFYQASTSEMYGLVQETPQKETTPFYPRSPYAVAKLYAYWITVNYREAYPRRKSIESCCDVGTGDTSVKNTRASCPCATNLSHGSGVAAKSRRRRLSKYVFPPSLKLTSYKVSTRTRSSPPNLNHLGSSGFK